MRIPALIFMGLLVRGTLVVAQQEQIDFMYPRGHSSGFCQGGPMSWYCVDRLKEEASDLAIRDADFQCEMRGGKLRDYSAHCNEFCTPFQIPEQGPPTFVNCDSNCSVQCAIPVDNN